MKLTTNQKGAIAEAVIAAEAIKLGITVLKPVAEHGRYDLAFDPGSEVIRVQCKWRGVKGDVINVSAIGSYHSPTRGYVRSTYGRSEIDALAVYAGELDRCFLCRLCCLNIRRRSSYGYRSRRTINGQR